MSDNLHRMVKQYINDHHSSESEQIKAMLVAQLEHDVREEVLQEGVSVLESKQKQFQEKLESEFANKRLKEKIEEANEITLFAVFVGFVIGLLVNQTTDLVSSMKNTLSLNSDQKIITLVVIFLLLIVVYFCYKRVFLDKIAKIIQEKYKN